MAKIKVHKSFGVDLTVLKFADLNDPNAEYDATSTRFIVDYGGGERDEFRGTGFTYNSSGVPVAGTVTSYKHVEAGKTLVEVKNASVPVSLIVKATLNPSSKNIATLFDTLLGGADTLEGGDLREAFVGLGGNDKLRGNGGNDLLDGGAGNDQLRGHDGNDTLKGGKGSDRLEGHEGNDKLSGGAGNDELLGAQGNDVLKGNGGKDTLTGGDGDDTADGGGGRDTIHGNAGNDHLKGGAGKDKIFGETGDDRLHGGAGADRMDGGGGADVFIYKKANESKVAAPGRDTISNFAKSADKIDLSAIDGDLTTAGKNAFTFVGSDPFSNSAGELRFSREDDGTYVYADRNGDGVADFAIFLKKDGGIVLDAGNFIL